MPSVSEITQRLIDIVQANSDLNDVWIRGKISNVRHIRNRPLNFTLVDENKKIECVIFDNGISFQENLPSERSDVYVKGQIFIYGVRSEYRFKITDIKLSGNSLSDQSVSVPDLTEALENTIADHSGEAQGQISDIYEADNGWGNFKIKNAATDGIPNDIIECSLPPSIANNLTFPLTEGEEVSVKGNFKIFSVRNTYQIVINRTIDIQRVSDSLAETSTSRCNVCGQYHDTGYQLCTMCHYAQVEHEGIVVGAVMRYFEKFTNFSTQREYSIRLIGTIRGRADVVLLDSQGNLAVIAECKRIRYDGNEGIDQLKSYLFPTESKLGLFADDTDPYKWTFLKNLGRRNFAQITRTEFEALVDQEIPPSDEQSKSRLWQYIAGVLGVALFICLVVLITQLNRNEKQTLKNQLIQKEQQILNNTQTISQLANENKGLESRNQASQKQIIEKNAQIQEKEKQIGDKNETISRLKRENEYLRKKLVGIQEKNEESDPEETILPQPPQPNPKPFHYLLNFLNTADVHELADHLPGIGKTLAERIVQYREKHGKFDSVDDITKVSSIGKITLENLKKENLNLKKYFREKQNE